MPVRIISVLSVVVVFYLLDVCSQDGLRVGEKAPAFELPSVGGKTIALREFENKKVVIVHFWKSK